MNAEEIMNSGKMYKVMELPDEQGNYQFCNRCWRGSYKGYSCTLFITVTAN